MRNDFTQHTTLGRTGLQVGRIGLAAGYRVPTAAVEKAFEEFGVNYFYWETRKPGMGEALRRLARSSRERMVIAIQSYDHLGFWLGRSVEKALGALGVERADVLLLGWVNRMPSRRVMDAALRLRERELVGYLGFTGHKRTFHGEMVRRDDSPFDLHQVRYSAAHRGAEDEVFRGLPDPRPGITTYTATRWGRLLRADKMPPGERPLTAAECYRFVLSHPAVDVCLAGPRTEKEMLEGLQALSQGPLSPEELERARRIGDFVHG